MAAIVKAEMIVVDGEEGGIVYLAKGATVPSYVSKEKLKELEEFNLIEVERPSRSRSSAKKTDDTKDADPKTEDTGSGDSGDGDADSK